VKAKAMPLWYWLKKLISVPTVGQSPCTGVGLEPNHLIGLGFAKFSRLKRSTRQVFLTYLLSNRCLNFYAKQ